MGKIKMDPGTAFLYPMPMVLVGALVEDRVNFMAVAWVTRVNFKPPLFAVSLGSHHTNKGIEAHREFSINIPDVALIDKTDFCGIVSGVKTDKSELFDVFYGDLTKAPLIGECPISMSCTLHDIVKLPSNTLYIGEPKEVFVQETCMTDGKVDIRKVNPFTLTMPDNAYWSVGENVGKAWSIGKKLKNP
jgi:flavin reductase (DIM6/NTAB) family NADH-FMN oxidoreductase RutF